jgi:hypothetical protein
MTGHLTEGHLTEDQLLDQLYGVASHPHADSCAQCSARFGELQERRAELARPMQASPQFLAAQRSKIVARMEQRPSFGLKWVPALATACAIAIAFFVYRPAPAPPRPDIAVDEQLYSELYSIEQSTEPRAAAPIHALFESKGSEDNQ